MTSPADLAEQRQPTLRALRAVVETRFRDAVPSAENRRALLASGIDVLDASLDGGLGAGEMLHLDAPPGGGALTVAATWVRRVAAEGATCLVVDASGTTLPHAWVPSSTDGAIWVVVPQLHEAWVAVDLALRAGAFELVVAIDAPARADVAPRLRRLLHERSSRLLLVGAAPFRVPRRAHVSLAEVRWTHAAVGDAPTGRALSIDTGFGRGGELFRDDVRTDRLRVRSRAPDRSTSRRTRPR